MTLDGIGGLSKCEWTFNRTLVASYDNSGLNSSRYILNSTKCSLTIINASTADSGLYDFQAKDGIIIKKKSIFLHVHVVDCEISSTVAYTCVSEIVLIVVMLLWLMCVVIDVCFHSFVATMYVKLRDRILGTRGAYDFEKARAAVQHSDNAY